MRGMMRAYFHVMVLAASLHYFYKMYNNKVNVKT